jgi:hypothetical protein
MNGGDGLRGGLSRRRPQDAAADAVTLPFSSFYWSPPRLDAGIEAVPQDDAAAARQRNDSEAAWKAQVHSILAWTLELRLFRRMMPPPHASATDSEAAWKAQVHSIHFGHTERGETSNFNPTVGTGATD